MSRFMSLFNVKDGFEEAIVRGYKQALLSPDDYRKLGMADTLEDLRSGLEDTDYGGFLQDEPSPLSVTTIGVKARQKLADEFKFLYSMSSHPLKEFLDFIVAERMIDNVVSLINGALNNKSPEELLARVDPVGWAPEMRALVSLDVSSGYDELYRTVLIDTPVGRYFEAYLNQREAEAQRAAGGANPQVRTMAEVGMQLNELDLEIMRASLKKSWLEHFYAFCCRIGGITEEVMGDILKRQADFLVLSVTLNSLNTPMGDSSQLADRNSLYPHFGFLYPEGTDRMRKSFNDATVRAALESFPQYAEFYEQCKAFYVREEEEDTEGGVSKSPEGPVEAKAGHTEMKSLEDCLYQEEIKMCEMAFEQQMHYGIFYAWVKLKEQEVRNILWIADMILMKRKQYIDQILPIFAPRY